MKLILLALICVSCSSAPKDKGWEFADSAEYVMLQQDETEIFLDPSPENIRISNQFKKHLKKKLN